MTDPIAPVVAQARTGTAFRQTVQCPYCGRQEKHVIPLHTLRQNMRLEWAQCGAGMYRVEKTWKKEPPK